MPEWLKEVLDNSVYFMPHGHCYLWLPSLLGLHVVSDMLIGLSYLLISMLLYLLVRKLRLPFSPVFIAFGLFIGLCGLTHFMGVWTIWNPDYFADGLLKAATALASVATAIGLLYVRPQITEMVAAARLSEERRLHLERANAELEALYKKVRHLDDVKSQFFANVSHELRTPLTLILAPVERMMNDDNLSAEQKKQLASVSRNSKSLLKLVNDFLDASKLEAGKMGVHYSRLDLVPVLKRITTQFELLEQQREIDFNVTAPDALEVEVDPDMFERIVINLMSNAFKFTPAGGAVTLSVNEDGDRFRLTVRDTGIGIQAEQRELIFERFRQADSSATRKHGGTGLGLAIVKDVVELHGGTIALDPTVIDGASFVVELPMRAPSSSKVEIATPDSDASRTQTDAIMDEVARQLQIGDESGSESPYEAQPSRPTIVLAEDNREVADLVASILSDDYNIQVAQDGAAGLQLALVQRPDLIISDIMMPELSGDQLLAQLRLRNEFQHIPVLFLTAKSDDELRIRLLSKGAQDYLVKPFLPQELLARVRNLVTMKLAGDALRESLLSASNDVRDMANQLSAKHRQLQNAVEAAEILREHAERASDIKTSFLGLVSHELRTPLSTISLNVELLMRLPEVTSQERILQRVQRLTRATQQISELIESLLEYTRIESGKVSLHLTPVDLVMLAREVIDMHAEHASSEVKLSLVSPPFALSSVMTDARLLSVVCNNLVSNALKFTQRGTVSLSLYAQDNWQVIQVSDTGVGIRESDLPKIFQPFEQLNPLEHKTIHGVGLGLALVRQLVDTFNGKIEVESAYGEGSVFRVYVPASLERASA
jgi:signal transduction histidine kinase